MNIDWATVFAGVKTVLDPLAASSWPIAFGAVAYGLRAPIGNLLGRVRNATVWGATLDIDPSREAVPQQLGSPGESNKLPAAIDPNTLPPAEPVFDVLDAALLAILDKELPGDDRRKLLWSIRQRSISEANRLHEFHYRLIYGSQIRALTALNQSSPAPLALYERFYDEQVKADPANVEIHRHRTFEQWGEFLVNAGYVEVVDGTDPQMVRITHFGRQFCAWLGFTGAFQNKPG